MDRESGWIHCFSQSSWPGAKDGRDSMTNTSSRNNPLPKPQSKKMGPEVTH